MESCRPSAPALGKFGMLLCSSETAVYLAQRASDACVATALTCMPAPHHNDVHALAAAGKAGSVQLLAVAPSQLPASQSPDRAAAQENTPAAE